MLVHLGGRSKLLIKRSQLNYYGGKNMANGIKVFTNIDDEDFVGMMHGIEYKIEAGKSEAFPEKRANHLAHQLAEKMIGKKDQSLLLAPGNVTELEKTITSELVMVNDEPEEKEVEVKAKEAEEETFADLKPKKKVAKKVAKKVVKKKK